uniref:Uncharacterized protein n=1 Tax=Pipistrellus kuhlii TaxID=59472 RepID=A0A7J7YWY4_PIPKU|nr:hypothetical protein mPipKuh1_009868 [Pipistrellus kuhlii]
MGLIPRAVGLEGSKRVSLIPKGSVPTGGHTGRSCAGAQRERCRGLGGLPSSKDPQAPNPELSRPRPAPYCEAMSDALQWASPMPFWALLFMKNGKEDPVPLELAQKGTFPLGTFLLASLITLCIC